MSDEGYDPLGDIGLPPESELAFVSELLAGLPRPTMPTDVAARLSATLESAVAEPAPNVVPLRRRRLMPLLAAAAVVMILGGIGVRLSATSGVTQSSAASELAQLSNQAAASLTNAPMAAMSTAGSLAATKATTNTSSPSPGWGSAGGAAAALLPGTFAATSAGTASCLAGLGQQGGTVRLLFATTYRGNSAVAIVVATATGTTRMFVVGPDCSETANQLLATSDLPSPPAPSAT